HRHIVNAGALRGAPATLACDDLEGAVGTGRWTYRDRLNDATLLDRSGEFFELRSGEMAARSARIRMQKLNGDAALPGTRPLGRRVGLGAHVADQRSEPAPEA